MNNLDIEKKFEKLVSSKEIENLKSISIFQIDKNTYDIFNKFKLKKKSNNEIFISSDTDDNVYCFSNMKIAICYCIFERRGKYVDAKRIVQLDKILAGIHVSEEIHKKLFKKSKTLEDKLIHLAKLNEDKHKKQNILSELDGYLAESSYWQKTQYRLKTE